MSDLRERLDRNARSMTPLARLEVDVEWIELMLAREKNLEATVLNLREALEACADPEEGWPETWIADVFEGSRALVPDVDSKEDTALLVREREINDYLLELDQSVLSLRTANAIRRRLLVELDDIHREQSKRAG